LSTDADATLTLAQELIRRPSVSPEDHGCLQVIGQRLEAVGFRVERMPFGPVENLWARHGNARPVLCFAGHTDVVPTGPREEWQTDPFEPMVRDGLLYGRGAADMKSGLAAMVTASERFVAAHPNHGGSLAFLLTSDEEGPSVDGTRRVVETLEARGEKIDWCVVGEPSSTDALGDMVKIGRRGSINVWLTVEGREGHVAYPQRADNPIPKLVAMLAELDALALDEGTEWFQPSNLEITELQVGNPAHNVIPPRAVARISIRFNDLHSGAELARLVTEIAEKHGGTAEPIISGEPFLTQPGEFSDLLAAAIRAETGIEPELSTSGGTSDARFLKDLAPVIDFGPVNATMHKRDEAIAVDDLNALTRIYRRIAMAALGA
jgi:succinyl-diaminopimelate desuccinylase